MKQLSGFLKKFKVLVKDDRELKDSIKQNFEEIFNVKIDRQKIELTNKVVFLKIGKESSVLRSELFLKKEIFLDSLNKKTGLNFKDIRF